MEYYTKKELQEFADYELIKSNKFLKCMVRSLIAMLAFWTILLTWAIIR